MHFRQADALRRPRRSSLRGVGPGFGDLGARFPLRELKKHRFLRIQPEPRSVAGGAQPTPPSQERLLQNTTGVYNVHDQATPVAGNVWAGLRAVLLLPAHQPRAHRLLLRSSLRPPHRLLSFQNRGLRPTDSRHRRFLPRYLLSYAGTPVDI